MTSNFPLPTLCKISLTLHKRVIQNVPIYMKNPYFYPFTGELGGLTESAVYSTYVAFAVLRGSI